MNSDLIYLDHSATTPVDDRVFAAMKPYFTQQYGNPSSIHRYGQVAEAAIQAARQSVANIFGCDPESVFFTASATESNNLVLHGLGASRRARGEQYHVLTTPVEHASVLAPLRQIQLRGQGTYSYLPVDRGGKLQLDGVQSALDGETSLVSVIFGNNEIGTINPVLELGELLQNHPAYLHTDAVQCANFIPLIVDALNVDFLTLSAHKFYGPKGIGILYARNPELLEPVLQGGSQEFGMRPGTHNVPLIVGIAKALEIAQSTCEAENNRLKVIRDYLTDRILHEISACELTGDPFDRLPHHASFVLDGIDSNQLLAALDVNGYACSSGSACKVGNPEPSELLLSLGYSETMASGGLRVTFGRSSTREQAEQFISTLIEVVERMRSKESV